MEPVIKFRGGAWIGFLSATWPFGIIEISKDSLLLEIEGLKKMEFSKDTIISLKLKMYIPLFGQGLQINYKFEDQNYSHKAYFWYWSNKKLKVTLEEFGWLIE